MTLDGPPVQVLTTTHSSDEERVGERSAAVPISDEAAGILEALSWQLQPALTSVLERAIRDLGEADLERSRAHVAALERALEPNGDQPLAPALAPGAVEEPCEDEEAPPAADTSDPEPEASHEPPAAPPPSSPAAADPPARHNEPFTQEDLERHARVLLDERKATTNAIAEAMARARCRDQGRPYSRGVAKTVTDRVRAYLADLERRGEIEQAGRWGRGVRYGWTSEKPLERAAAEAAGQEPEPDTHRSAPADGSEDVMVTIQREIRRTLNQGPARIPTIATQHDRPAAQVAQAMQLLVRDEQAVKIPGGQYALTE